MDSTHRNNRGTVLARVDHAGFAETVDMRLSINTSLDGREPSLHCEPQSDADQSVLAAVMERFQIAGFGRHGITQGDFVHLQLPLIPGSQCSVDRAALTRVLKVYADVLKSMRAMAPLAEMSLEEMMPHLEMQNDLDVLFNAVAMSLGAFDDDH